ncbi:hypothetical protein BC829DRAFT_414140 [Chytridium lagenaria]|nr:hypothetical protein BC829DRAFT_414140 [Chytridium lagenaria]
MELKDIQLDLHAYTTIVEASAKADIPDFALHWFQEISRRGHSIDVKALHALMLAYVRVNKITPAMQIYDEIVKREIWSKMMGSMTLAVPNEKRRKRMGYLKKVMEEMQKRELKPDGYTYSHLVQQFSQMGLRDQIKTAFTLAVDDARLLISKMKEGDKESLGCERGRSFPLSSALYSQMIRHLQVEKGTVEEFLKVLSVAMEFQDHVQVDGKAILSIMRGLRSCGAFKEVVEVYKWARSSPLGLLAFNHSTCPAGYTFNRFCTFYAKWLDVMTKEMQYLLRHGYPVTERNWLTFCGVVVRLKRSPLVAVKTMDEGLKEYIAALGENNGGKSIMEALRVTAVMLEVMVMRLVRKGDKFARARQLPWIGWERLWRLFRRWTLSLWSLSALKLWAGLKVF